MADRVGQQLGNYRLIRLLGEGGFAEVYLGEHIHLSTEAAIKVLHTQLTNEDVEQFRNEARTIARLKHRHIVRVFDFGVEGKTPFLVMDYASNGTLRQRYPRGSILPVSSIVSYVKQVAAALQYAHNQKLIHRDIKPENMLLESDDEILLSDFGIALVAQSSRYQSTQDVVGTVAYMSPEQIQGKPRPASDIYSLAIVVYEWLSGTRPFHGSFTEMCTQHMFAPPPPLNEKVPNISSDVEQVVITALSKDPHQRFMNVQAFATALEQAAQENLPTFVKPVSSVPSSSSLPPTVLGTPFLPPTVAVTPPTRSIPKTGILLFSYSGHSRKVNFIAWSPDGKQIATASSDKSIHICDASIGRNISTYSGHSGPVNAIAWSTDGRFLGSASADRTVAVWDVATGAKVGSYRGHSKSVKTLIWLPDKIHIASYSDDKTIHIWDVTNGKMAHVYDRLPLEMKLMALSPDAQHIVWSKNDNVIFVKDISSGHDICTYRDHADEVKTIAWSPKGHWIASFSQDQTIQVWDANTGRTMHTNRGYSGLFGDIISWSPDSKRIALVDYATTSFHGTVHIWDVATETNTGVYRGHAYGVQAVAWSPDSTCIASASTEAPYTVHVWQAV
jgi:eukaryotic-like serine/threonine-protein kinase